MRLVCPMEDGCIIGVVPKGRPCHSYCCTDMITELEIDQ